MSIEVSRTARRLFRILVGWPAGTYQETDVRTAVGGVGRAELSRAFEELIDEHLITVEEEDGGGTRK